MAVLFSWILSHLLVELLSQPLIWKIGLQGSNMVLLMPQSSGNITICLRQLGEICIPCYCRRHKINEKILYFAIFYIVGVPIARLSWSLFKFFPIQVCLLKMRPEVHLFAIIGCNTLLHAIHMCIFLCHKEFCDTHVCQAPIWKLRMTPYWKFLSCFHLVEQDLNRVFRIVRQLHLVLI